MSYLNYDGLAYFKSKLTNWVDQNYLSKTNTGNLTVAGHVTFTNPITGDLDGKAKKDWLGQKIDETYIKSIATNDNAGTIVYTKGNGSTNHILIDLLQGATPIANGRAGLVPAPTVSEMNYFLRGDGNWAVPTDVYVNQNLIVSSNNNQFPVLLSGTSGTPATKTNATVGYTNVVSVNPMTNALMASQFISKHPTYNRQSAITSKVQYSLNFTDIVSGAGHNLGEVVGYVDTPANGGEHELGFRLFGNPNVQGTEEDYVYMGVGLSKTNVAYGHAPSTPLPSAHNEPTDIITRDWLARNGSETGLVHTSMNETIDGTKTFVKKIIANDGMNATGNIATDSLTVRQNATVGGTLGVTGTSTLDGNVHMLHNLDVDGTANVDGASTLHGDVHMYNNLDVDKNANIDGNETVGGTLTTTGNISTANGNISTTNGTISSKTGSIGTGGLIVTGPSNLNGGASVTGGNGLSVTGNETVSGTLTVGGKLTGNGGAEISGGSGLKVNGNETVTGTTTATGKITANGGVEVSGGNGLVVNGNETVNGEIYKVVNNTPQEYVSYVTNKQETKTTIVNNLIKDKGGLAVDSNKNIYVSLKSGGGVKLNNNGELYVDFSIDSGASAEAQAAANAMKEQILSTLGIQIPLTGNKTLYVNKDHVSATNTWRNSQGVIDKTVGTQDKPFASITEAINCATQGYSLGNNSIYIKVVKSTDPYIESLTLPEFSHASGNILIQSNDYDNIATVVNSSPTYNTVSIRGGSWYLRRLNITANFSKPNDDVNHYPAAISCTGGSVIIQGCNISASYSGEAHTRNFYYYLISSFNGFITLSPMDSYANHLTTNVGNATGCSVLYLERQGQIHIPGTNTTPSDDTAVTINDTLCYAIRCSGSMTRFANVTTGSSIVKTTGTNYGQVFTGTMTGIPYTVSGGGYISGGIHSSMPGDDTSGIAVSSSTYSWVG